eukprot:5640775-Pyramimonas_sp.AAC.1
MEILPSWNYGKVGRGTAYLTDDVLDPSGVPQMLLPPQKPQLLHPDGQLAECSGGALVHLGHGPSTYSKKGCATMWYRAPLPKCWARSASSCLARRRVRAPARCAYQNR